MTTTDRSGATEKEFRARLAAIETAPAAPEECVERVAAALWKSQHPSAAPWAKLPPRLPSRDLYRRLASAAIAAMKPGAAQ